MSSNKAIVIQGPRIAQVVVRPIPALPEDHILVKTHAVGVSLHDLMIVDFVGQPGCRLGCDYSGVVEEVGSKVIKHFKEGDRVCGCIYGGNALNPADGAYEEYITAKSDVQIMIPQNLSFEEAAALGVAILNIGKTPYQVLELPLPPETVTASFPVLIYGGSTTTGAVAMQFAKLSGCQVITTCSPHNFEYVKSLGADKIFDDHSSTCAKEINDFTNNRLAYVIECISARGAPGICFNAHERFFKRHYTHIGWSPGEQATDLRPNVGVTLIIGQKAFGEKAMFTKGIIESSPENFEFAKMSADVASSLLVEDKIRPHRPIINEGGEGLEGVLRGVQIMKEGKVSAKKLVYTL